MNKFILLLLFGSFIFCGCANAQQLTIQEVIDKIKGEVTVDWSSQTVDVIKAGDPNQKITGIATTFMATFDVLKKAVAQNCNFIITHEPTFYNHQDVLDGFANDPVVQKKLAYIKEHNLVVWRFHDHVHRTNPDGISEGIIKKFGWEDHRVDGKMVFDIPGTNLAALAGKVARNFGTDILRVVGDRDLEVTKVGMVLGAAGSAAHFRAINQNGIDVLIIGEAREWETIPYVLDAVEAGIDIGLIVMGHADSEEMGMSYCADWLKKFIENVPINFIPAGNPMWAPKK